MSKWADTRNFDTYRICEHMRSLVGVFFASRLRVHVEICSILHVLIYSIGKLSIMY